MRHRMLWFVLAVMLTASSGCATLTGMNLSPPAAGWVREEFRAARSHCRDDDCQTTIGTPHGAFTVASRERMYEPREIPGWDKGSASGRVAGSILQGLIRRQGLTTDRTEIGLGTRVVSDSGENGWQLRCSIFWIDDEDVAYNKADLDHVTAVRRRTEGADCRVVAARDTPTVRWRFRAGVAPVRDSLAALYDSLAAAGSAAVTQSPPMSLERLALDGTVAARYAVRKDTLPPSRFVERVNPVHRVQVAREGGALLAVFYIDAGPHIGSGTHLDLAPETSAEEARALRLFAAAMAVGVPAGS